MELLARSMMARPQIHGNKRKGQQQVADRAEGWQQGTLTQQRPNRRTQQRSARCVESSTDNTHSEQYVVDHSGSNCRHVNKAADSEGRLTPVVQASQEDQEGEAAASPAPVHRCAQRHERELPTRIEEPPRIWQWDHELLLCRTDR